MDEPCMDPVEETRHLRPPFSVLVTARWSLFVVLLTAAVPSEVQQMAEQHEGRDDNEKPVTL